MYNCIFMHRGGIIITPRLEMILRNTDGKKIADIGTDHGYIPLELAKSGKTVIATDISEGPLSAARRNVGDNPKIELRCGNGLEPIKKGEADCIIIAGMGGELIEKIISAEPEKAKESRLVLQPMNSRAELRKFLTSEGFAITGEDLAKEGHKIYNLIVAKYVGNTQERAEIDYHLPKELYTHELFYDLVSKKRREFEKICNGMAKSKSQEDFGDIKKLLCEVIEIQGRICDEAERNNR